MQVLSPHFLLYSEASGSERAVPRWKFVLQSVGSEDVFSAADSEPQARLSRLELLAVVRGLEALDQPSRVTLVTRSRYVARGIRRELNHWRERRWRWERFGKLVPICDHDLWQRVDRALEFHGVECVRWQYNAAPDLAVVAAMHAADATSFQLVQRLAWRAADRAVAGRAPNRSFRRAFDTLRDGILSPLSVLLRPAFTRAA